MVERIQLTPAYSISRLIKGGWHLAGGHGPVDKVRAIEDMRVFAEAGITTFDCADIYTGVEQLIGSFMKKYAAEMRSGNLPSVQIHTKYVPDYDALGSLTKPRPPGKSLTDRSNGYAWSDLTWCNLPGGIMTFRDMWKLHCI